MTIDIEAVRTALLSPDLTIGKGIGTAHTPGEGEACTIAEINLVLTGKLTDGPHPCMSEVVRRWVIRIQDAMPASMRNSPEWRQAATGIAGSASTDDAEKKRRDLILTWMWDAMGDEAVIKAISAAALPKWNAMLNERSAAAADAAYAAAAAAAYAAAAYAAAAAAADAAYVAAYAAYAAAADAAADAAAEAAAHAAAAAEAADRAAYWSRRNPAALLTRLVEIR